MKKKTLKPNRIHPIAHNDGARDSRYQVRPEYTGSPRLQNVARFCGEWIGAADTYPEALGLAKAHRIAFCAKAGIPCQYGVAS